MVESPYSWRFPPHAHVIDFHASSRPRLESENPAICAVALYLSTNMGIMIMYYSLFCRTVNWQTYSCTNVVPTSNIKNKLGTLSQQPGIWPQAPSAKKKRSTRFPFQLPRPLCHSSRSQLQRDCLRLAETNRRKVLTICSLSLTLAYLEFTSNIEDQVSV